MCHGWLYTGLPELMEIYICIDNLKGSSKI